jgi:hypothetical protein
MYLPWPPYFSKIAQSDVFVFLDDVQYPRSKSFFNRNAIKGAQGPLELSVPIKGKSDLLPVLEIAIDDSQPWRKKHWKSISLNYAKAPFFPRYRERFEAVYRDESLTRLSALNIALIRLVCECLDVSTRLVSSSELNAPAGTGADRILGILKALGADRYLTGSGAGSLRYMDEEAYRAAGVRVLWHAPVSAPYPQLWGAFAPDLAMIDLLFNCGPAAKDRLLEGRAP